MQNRTARILISILLFIPLYSSGQKMVNSPLGRFNLGILEPAGSFKSAGMGGVGTALRDNNNIFFLNPASYSSLDTNSFVFDFGIDYGINVISGGSGSELSEDLNFDHIIIGFPIKKNWGFAAGLVPMSNSYYNIAVKVTEISDGYDPLIGEYTAYHGGSGGFTNFFFGTGLNITKNISAGANMSLLFGSLRRYNEFDFGGDEYYFSFQSNKTEKLQMSGIGFDFGLQYTTNLKNSHFLNIGTSFSTPKNCKSTYENLAFRFNMYNSTDTLNYTLNDSSKAYLPGTIRGGVAFGKKNKFVASLDYIFTGWKNADFPGIQGTLVNTYNLLAGIEYTPDRFSNYSFLKRIDYRAGGHLGNNYLSVDGYKVKEFGFSIGTGVPLRRRYPNPANFYSKINAYIDYTRRSVSGAPYEHRENYFTIGMSLNLYDNWFIKRRYD